MAVVSHLWIGHIPTYHGLLVERLLALGCRVVSLSPPPGKPATNVTWREFGPHLVTTGTPAKSISDHSRWSRMSVPLRRLSFRTGVFRARRARRNWRLLGSALNQVVVTEGRRLDLAIVVYLDVGFLEAGVTARFVEHAMPSPWCGIWTGPLLAGSKPRTWLARIVETDAPFGAKNCRGVWVTHPDLTTTLSGRHFTAPVVAMPDLADLRDPGTGGGPAKHMLRSAAGRKVVGLFGTISLRKGMLTFIEAARLASVDMPELFFVAAGEFSPEICGEDFDRIEEAVAGAPSNFMFMPGRISDGPEFNALVAAADVLFAVYRDFPYHSNLLTKAAHFRKPVIVARGELMERCVRRFALGEAVVADDPEAGLQAIRAVLQERNLTGERLGPRFEDYASENDVLRMDTILRAALTPSVAVAAGVQDGSLQPDGAI